MLRSLEIKNFRTFSHLAIERLGRVNLIVGKNGVGKTTLLEALRLYGSIWPPITVQTILRERNEVERSSKGKALLALHSLFHDRRANRGDVITIGPHGAEDTSAVFRMIASGDSDSREELDEEARFLPSFGGWSTLRILSGDLSSTVRRDKPSSGARRSESWQGPKPPYDPPYLRGPGVDEDAFANWWDDLALTESEQRILHAVRTIAAIQGVTFVGDPGNDRGRMAKVRVGDMREPVPLLSLGDGVVRALQIATALEYAAVQASRTAETDPGVVDIFPLLLIDEIESGVHHTLHADLWRFILQAARRLDVQVFATTHSQDCLRGFAEAVAEDEEADGQVIRLEAVEGEDQTGAVIIDGEDLPIVVRDSIEVR